MLRIVLCVALMVIGMEAARPGGDSAFFLKAPKSVPRAGRSAPGQNDRYYFKIPRFGNRDENEIIGDHEMENVYEWKYPENDADFQEYSRIYKDYGINDGDDGLPRRSRRYNNGRSIMDDGRQDMEM